MENTPGSGPVSGLCYNLLWATLVGCQHQQQQQPERSCSKKFKVNIEITLTSPCDRQRKPHSCHAPGKRQQVCERDNTRMQLLMLLMLLLLATSSTVQFHLDPVPHKVNLSFVKRLQELMRWRWWWWAADVVETRNWVHVWGSWFLGQNCWLSQTRWSRWIENQNKPQITAQLCAMMNN